ncbi:hypothetical protein [Nocardia anaemiae]|uniref:hypothetical protein n=1 Tax=Nocardia anaemiae TaxID=263910 RepID=UPI0007A4B8FF|nr:hypothetical protein [Nocardia anaemiae]
MGQSLHIDPDRIHALVTELAAVAESAHQDLAELTNALAHEGKPWGDDEPGRTVGETYEPQAKKGLEGYKNLVDNLRGLSKGVSEVADALHDQDRNSGQQIRSTGSNPPVSVTPDPVWSGTGTPLAPSPATDSATNANATPTYPSTSTPTSSTQPTATPTAYPQPETPGYSPVATPTPVAPQSVYPDSSTPPPGPDASQPAAQSSTGDGDNSATPSVADDSMPAAPGATSPAAAAPPRTGDPAVVEKPTGTPWSRTPGATFPPIQSGTPWSGVRTGARPPAQVFAPPPAGVGAAQPGDQKRKDKSRKKKRESPEAAQARVPTDAAALAAVRELADRHGLQIVGFDTSGIGQETVAQLAAAIDDILGKYPFVELGGLEITDLGDGRISRVTRDRSEDESQASTGSWILLDRALVANPAQLSERVSAAIQSGNSVAGSEERPMYSTIVGDLGRIMESQAGQPIQRLAQRALITEYRRIDGPWGARDSLARIVGGYRRWRDQLGANSILDGRFQPSAALVAAFVEVELRGDDACGPARALYRLLVEGARGRSTPR